MHSTSKRENLSWIDICKFIGIFLVVFGHCLQTFKLTDISLYKELWQFIYLFHMPLFFILAGYLYKQKSKKENFKKIICCLLIPYLIYQIFYFPFVYVNKVFIHNLPAANTFLKMVEGLFLGDGYGNCVCLPCWFILSMIQIRFLFIWVKDRLINLLFILIFSFAILKILFVTSFDLKFCLDNTIMALPYFVFGILLKKYIELKQQNIYNSNHGYIFGGGILVVLLLLKMILLNNGLIQMNLLISSKLADKSLLLMYIAGILGSLLIILFGKFFEKFNNKFTEVISKNTLFIMFFHWVMLFITSWVKLPVLLLKTNPMLIFSFSIFYSICILIVNYFLIMFLAKRCPIVLGKYSPKEKL